MSCQKLELLKAAVLRDDTNYGRWLFDTERLYSDYCFEPRTKSPGLSVVSYAGRFASIFNTVCGGSSRSTSLGASTFCHSFMSITSRVKGIESLVEAIQSSIKDSYMDWPRPQGLRPVEDSVGMPTARILQWPPRLTPPVFGSCGGYTSADVNRCRSRLIIIGSEWCGRHPTASRPSCTTTFHLHHRPELCRSVSSLLRRPNSFTDYSVCHSAFILSQGVNSSDKAGCEAARSSPTGSSGPNEGCQLRCACASCLLTA